MEELIWARKYAPKNFDDYVGNDEFIAKVKHWIEHDCPPNLILYSLASGTGKTSLCHLLANSLDSDIMYINASDENGIEIVRDKIKNFASSVGFSRWKIIILDEFSFFSLNAQSALNSLMESTSKHTRFFLTGNYIEKFLPSIVSRSTSFQIQSPPPKKIFENISNILKIENVEFEQSDLIKIIKQYFPDQRSMLNYCQDNSYTGKLVYSVENLTTNEYCSKILEELKAGNDVKSTFTNIRQIIADAKIRQFDDLFKFLFDNLEEFVPNGHQASIILHIANYQQKSQLVLDKEIQVAAMFIEILREIK